MHFDSDSDKDEKDFCSGLQQVPYLFFMLLDSSLRPMPDQL